MKFFLPYAATPQSAEEVYGQIRAKAELDYGYSITNNRIFAIDHRHNGVAIREEVGKPSPTNGETVIAIFNTDGGPNLVCTTDCGVRSGAALLTAADAGLTPFD